MCDWIANTRQFTYDCGENITSIKALNSFSEASNSLRQCIDVDLFRLWNKIGDKIVSIFNAIDLFQEWFTRRLRSKESSQQVKYDLCERITWFAPRADYKAFMSIFIENLVTFITSASFTCIVWNVDLIIWTELSSMSMSCKCITM